MLALPLWVQAMDFFRGNVLDIILKLTQYINVGEKRNLRKDINAAESLIERD